jgi:hypothetical protein
MNEIVFTDELLDRLRQQGDPLADSTVEAVLEKYPATDVLDVLQHLVRIPPRAERPRLYERLGIDPELRDNLESFFRQSASLPPWMDADLVRRGKEVYQQQVFFTFVTLACASLPACYCWSPESSILGITGRLKRDVPSRLPETAQMVVDVMASEALFHGTEAAGPGLRAVVKVRLMHAVIRQLIMGRGRIATVLEREHGEGEDLARLRKEKFFARFVVPEGSDEDRPKSWNVNRDGVPINQEQLAATLLTFSYVTLNAIRQFRVHISEADERAFMHRWNVIGHLLGIDDAITTRLDRTADAEVLFHKVMTRNRRPAIDGPGLERALLDYLESNLARRAPIFSRLGGTRIARILTRELSGDDTSEVIGVRLGTGDRIYRVPLWAGLKLFGSLKNIRGLKLVSELLFRWLSDRLWGWRRENPTESETVSRREMGRGDIVLPDTLTALSEDVRRRT